MNETDGQVLVASLQCNRLYLSSDSVTIPRFRKAYCHLCLSRVAGGSDFRTDVCNAVANGMATEPRAI